MTTCPAADCVTAVANGAVTGASRAPEQPRLQAAAAAQPDQVRASRARIVEACDTERRRLERDLHDGAQQRLVTLSLILGRARHREARADSELAALIESASPEAAEALTELREVARRIHLAVLTQTGRGGAIQALVERSPVAAASAAGPDGRFPATIGATAHFVVSKALANVANHSLAGSPQVTTRQLHGWLVVQVTIDGTGGARPAGHGLRGLADRVAPASACCASTARRVGDPPGRRTSRVHDAAACAAARDPWREGVLLPRDRRPSAGPQVQVPSPPRTTAWERLGMLAVLRYTGGNSMDSGSSQPPATATATSSMRPAPARGSRRLPAAGTPYLLGAGDGQDLWFLGNLVTWKATGEQTHGRLTIAEFVHPAGFAPPLHRHLHEDEIFYILSGTAEFCCKGEQLRAAAGDFVLLPVGEPHTFLAGDHEPLHALQITTPSGFEHFAAAAGRPATERRLPDPARLDQPALGRTATLHGMQILGPPPRH